MTVTQGPAENREKEIQTEFPVEEGLTFGTQSQEGRQENLVPEEGSNVLSTDSFGIR